MRKKAVSLLGILSTSDYQANVSRGEFAELLMKASDYRESANAAGTVSVFADVSAKSQYSTAIRTAATNSWMSGYLGGNFKPDECHRRDHRDRDRCSREHRDWQAHGDRSASDHDGGRDLILGLCGDRTDLRIYAGEPGSKAESDRRAENGLRWAHLLHQEKKGYVWQSCHGFAPKRQNILS